MNDAAAKRVLKLAEGGCASVKLLAEKTGFSRSNISRLLRANGIVQRRRWSRLELEMVMAVEAADNPEKGRRALAPLLMRPPRQIYLMAWRVKKCGGLEKMRGPFARPRRQLIAALAAAGTGTFRTARPGASHAAPAPIRRASFAREGLCRAG